MLRGQGLELSADYGKRYFLGVGSGYKRGYTWESVGYLMRSHFRDVVVRSRFKSGRWLDAGCAKGFLLKIVSEHGWQPYGFDASLYAVEEARKVCPSAKVFVGDAQGRLPFPDGFFEVITACELVEHLPEPHKFFEEAFRLLRRDGLLFVTTPNALSVFGWRLAKDFCRAIYFSTPFLDETHVSYFTSKSIEGLLRRCGFSSVETECSLDFLWRWSVHVPSPFGWTLLAFAYR